MKDESSTSVDPAKDDFEEHMVRNRVAFADLEELDDALDEARRLVQHLRDLHRMV